MIQLTNEADIGPMARGDLRDELHRQVEESVKAGANLEFGGNLPAGEGAFYPVTLLTNVSSGMPAYHEELFGPVAAVIKWPTKPKQLPLPMIQIMGWALPYSRRILDERKR